MAAQQSSCLLPCWQSLMVAMPALVQWARAAAVRSGRATAAGRSGGRSTSGAAGAAAGSGMTVTGGVTTGAPTAPLRLLHVPYRLRPVCRPLAYGQGNLRRRLRLCMPDSRLTGGIFVGALFYHSSIAGMIGGAMTATGAAAAAGAETGGPVVSSMLNWKWRRCCSLLACWCLVAVCAMRLKPAQAA